MKRKMIMLIIIGCALFFGAGTLAWSASGNQGGKPPEEPETPPPTPIEGYYFWKLGHMDGPHTASKALGISRDGKVAVGTNVVVDFVKAFRIDIDWAINTEDPTGTQGEAPLYNELQVMESVGGEYAYAASNKTIPDDVCAYDKGFLGSTPNLDWCGSFPAGTMTTGMITYGVEWLFALEEAEEDPVSSLLIPDSSRGKSGKPVKDKVTEEDPEDPEDPVNYVRFPDFGGGISDMAVKDVSENGDIMVGYGNVKTGLQAFRADKTVVDEEGVPIPVQLTITEATDEVEGQTLQTSSAQAVSPDGNIIVGYGSANTTRAFVTWFEGTEVDPEDGKLNAILTSILLPNLAGGKYAEAYALTVTPDGVVYIAGRSDSPKGPQACIWFEGDDPTTEEIETWVVKGLGGLSKKSVDSVATGIVYREGSEVGDLMVVGRSKSILYPSEAFVWTGNPVLEPDGPWTTPNGTEVEYIGFMYDLEYILIKTGAAEASAAGSSWVLNEATGIALSDITNAGDNGPSARIVGWGTNPEGGIEAWLVANYPFGWLDFIKE